MGKLSFLIGMGAGYVLGARAGEKRYEQIKTRANKVWENPAVQDKVGDVAGQVKAKAPGVAAAAGSAAVKAATQAVRGTDKGTDDTSGPSASGQELPGTAGREVDDNLPLGSTGSGPGAEQLP